MRLLFLFLLPAYVGASSPYTYFKCFLRAADTNHDNSLSAGEIDALVVARAGWLQRGAFYAVGGGTGTVAKCDSNGDHLLNVVDVAESSCFSSSAHLQTIASKVGLVC
jgi:hypothetical protein